MITAIVLAAGAGSRMGQPKAGLVVGGLRLIEHAVALVRDGGCTEIIAVLRPGTDPHPAATAVINPDPESGMASSLRLGLNAANGDAALIVLVDQYGITAADVAAVIEVYRHGSPAVVARRGGKRSHPVLFERSLFGPVLQTLSGDDGARAFIEANPGLITYIDLADQVGDLDTPEDLARHVG